MNVLPCGHDAVLVEFLSGAERRAFVAAFDAAHPPDVVNRVAGAVTVLVRVTGPSALDGVLGAIESVHHAAAAGAASGVIGAADAPPPSGITSIPVVYDGPDLDQAAAAAGITVEEFVEHHGEVTWDVDFVGFLPGFAYLRSPQWQWQIPRLTTPRTSVPAGSVAVAERSTAVYPSASPGGWLLIGHTDVNMWDPWRDPPALLGDDGRVRFTRVDE